jgi:hypothetical protein
MPVGATVPEARPLRFCTEWLQPHSALLERLSSVCPVTAAAHRALQREWPSPAHGRKRRGSITTPATRDMSIRAGHCETEGGSPALGADLGEPGKGDAARREGDAARSEGDATLLAFAEQALQLAERGPARVDAQLLLCRRAQWT